MLAKAGMHLANAEGDESLVHLDADALQVWPLFCTSVSFCVLFGCVPGNAAISCCLGVFLLWQGDCFGSFVAEQQ